MSYFGEIPSPSCFVPTVIDYLGIGDAVAEIITRDENDRNVLHYTKQHYVKQQAENLVRLLSLSLTGKDATAENKKKWIKFLGNLYHCLIAKHGMKETTESKLLEESVAFLSSAHFNCLTVNELHIIDDLSQELSNFTASIQIDWDKLEGELFLEFYKDLLEKSPVYGEINVPEYLGKCMLFWRGISVQTTTGYFRLQKFDLLLQKITKYTGLQALSEHIIEHTEKIANRPPSTASRIKSDVLKPAHPKPVDIPVATSRIERKGLNVGCGLQDFFREETTQEPVFDEVVLIYQKHDNNDNNLKIQRFSNVAFKDYTTIFPAQKTGRNFADVFYFAMIAFWLITFMFKLQHVWASSTYIDEAVMGILFILLPLLVRHFVKSISGMRSHRQQQKMKDSVVDSSTGCNRMLSAYLRNEAVNQEFINTALTYYMLSTASDQPRYARQPITIEIIQEKVEAFLHNQSISVSFNVKAGINQLLKRDLITFEEGEYVPCSIDLGIERLGGALLQDTERCFE